MADRGKCSKNVSLIPTIISFRDAYSFLGAFLIASLISSALTVWPDSVTAVLRSRSPMTVRRADAPESSYPLLIAWWLSNPSLSFSLLSTHPNCISQCGCWLAKSISEYRFESHNYCTVEWNRYCSIQTRSSSFCLFTFHKLWYFCCCNLCYKWL